jgi:hypothetical protein
LEKGFELCSRPVNPVLIGLSKQLAVVGKYHVLLVVEILDF